MDLVNYNGNLYYVMGTHSYGKRVILKDQIKKAGISVNSLKVEIIKHGKGFCWVDTSIPC
jgi:hypothetical protein